MIPRTSARYISCLVFTCIMSRIWCILELCDLSVSVKHFEKTKSAPYLLFFCFVVSTYKFIETDIQGIWRRHNSVEQNASTACCSCCSLAEYTEGQTFCLSFTICFGRLGFIQATAPHLSPVCLIWRNVTSI